MDQSQTKIMNSPQFHELVTKRNKFSFRLAAIVLVVYWAFVALAVYAPTVFATPISSTSVWPLGLIIGFLIQAFAFVMTGIYTLRANGEFDRLAKEAIRAGDMK